MYLQVPSNHTKTLALTFMYYFHEDVFWLWDIFLGSNLNRSLGRLSIKVPHWNIFPQVDNMGGKNSSRALYVSVIWLLSSHPSHTCLAESPSQMSCINPLPRHLELSSSARALTLLQLSLLTSITLSHLAFCGCFSEINQSKKTMINRYGASKQ